MKDGLHTGIATPSSSVSPLSSSRRTWTSFVSKKQTREPTSSSSRRGTLLPVYSINLQPLSPHPYTRCTLAHTHAQKVKKEIQSGRISLPAVTFLHFLNRPPPTYPLTHVCLLDFEKHEGIRSCTERKWLPARPSLLLISYLTEREVAKVSYFSFFFTFVLKLITQNCVCVWMSSWIHAHTLSLSNIQPVVRWRVTLMIPIWFNRKTYSNSHWLIV